MARVDHLSSLGRVDAELQANRLTVTWVVYDETSHALCVEPQTGIPDAVNHADCPVLQPGGAMSLPLTLRWSP